MNEQFTRYRDLLLEWNENINLTAITDPQEIELKHFRDSLTIAEYLQPGASLIDVGTGAGFPGLPLKIERPDLSVTLLDSLSKRIQFLETVIAELGLEGISCIHGRAEDAGQNLALREQFDYATARAVANLSVLAEYCLPFVKVGGCFVAMKGPEIENELEEAKPAIRMLGGQIEKVIPAELEGLQHTIILIKKITKTPMKYPRKAGKAVKNPLK